MPLKITTQNVQGVKAAVRKELNRFAQSRAVLVGIQEDAGEHPDGDITNAQLGATLHFGDGHIPARPWLDVGVASGNQQYLDTIADALEDGMSPDQALDAIGVQAVFAVQNYMTELNTPPNAPSTIERKGSSNPLIDTGALRQAVTYKIVPKLPNEGME